MPSLNGLSNAFLVMLQPGLKGSGFCAHAVNEHADMVNSRAGAIALTAMSLLMVLSVCVSVGSGPFRSPDPTVAVRETRATRWLGGGVPCCQRMATSGVRC